MKLAFNRDEIERYCRSHQIARLEAFGSVLRDDFNGQSDLDLLATMREGSHPTLLDWAQMQEELGIIFGRRVDLISRRAVERSQNAIRRRSILSATEQLYAEE